MSDFPGGEKKKKKRERQLRFCLSGKASRVVGEEGTWCQGERVETDARLTKKEEKDPPVVVSPPR